MMGKSDQACEDTEGSSATQKTVALTAAVKQLLELNRATDIRFVERCCFVRACGRVMNNRAHKLCPRLGGRIEQWCERKLSECIDDLLTLSTPGNSPYDDWLQLTYYTFNSFIIVQLLLINPHSLLRLQVYLNSVCRVHLLINPL